MINPSRGSQQRKCITCNAGGDWSDHERRRLTRQLLLRWGGRGWRNGCKINNKKNRYGISSAEARTCGRLGVLFPHWLEVPQEGALLWHVPPPPMEKEDGPVWLYWVFRNLQTRRGTGEAIWGPLRNAVSAKTNCFISCQWLTSSYFPACVCACQIFLKKAHSF